MTDLFRFMTRCCWVGLLLFGGAEARAIPVLAATNQITIRDGWFFVDGEKIFIKGVCFFENHMVEKRFGRSPMDVLDHEFKRIRQAGFNAIRSQLTAPEIELANRHGLLVMEAANHLFFSNEYLDPKVLDRECRSTRAIVQATRSSKNILYYIIDNEPQITEGIYRQGETAFYMFHRRLIQEVKANDPIARVSMASYPPAAFLDYRLYDVISLNAYPICPAKSSIGYLGYLRWFKQEQASDKPLIVSEYGWEREQEESGLSDAAMTALDEQIQAGAVGSFFYTWRAFGPEGEGDNRWYGVIPNQGCSKDYCGPARPIFERFKEYFEAVVIEPHSSKIYRQAIPFEIYGTERTGSMEARVNNQRISLSRRGTLWWRGQLSADPSWKGEVQVRIIARDRQGLVLARKDRILHFPPSQAYRVRILDPNHPFQAGIPCRVTIRVEDTEGRPQPDLPLRIGIHHTVDMWGSQLLFGRSDSRGEYELVWKPPVPGHVTVMATIDQPSQDLVEPGVLVLRVDKDSPR